MDDGISEGNIPKTGAGDARGGEGDDSDGEEKGSVEDSIPFGRYTPLYSTTHKGPVKVASFSNCGRFAATGSVEGSAKLLSVSRMNMRGEGAPLASDRERDMRDRDRDRDRDPQVRPVIRTFVEHSMAVTTVDFHPVEPVLVTVSKDKSIKFFNHGFKVSKGATRQSQSLLMRRRRRIVHGQVLRMWILGLFLLCAACLTCSYFLHFFLSSPLS